MPDLNTILKNIMSFNVSGGMADKGKDFSVAAAGKYMSWTFNSNSPALISELKCKPDDKSSTVTVCTEVSWKPVVIKAFGQTHTLSFDKEFLSKIFYVEKGALDATDFWNQAVLEPSLLQVFGFEYRNGRWWPVPEAALAGKDFMPAPGEKAKEVKPQVVKGGHVTVNVRPPRIVICLEFACTAAAINCEPTETVSACRIHPQQYILSSIPYKLEESVTHLMRPERNAHDHHGSHGTQNPEEDQMVGDYGIGCYTDRNDDLPSPMSAFPYWRGTFQYYNLDTKKEFCAVDANSKAYTVKDKLETWNLVAFQKWDIDYSDRQGLYDNLHIAAGIKAPQVLIDALSKFKGAKEAMEFLHMAPSCVHDCLHFHWRWGPLTRYASVIHPKRWFWGWNEEKPYQVLGGPMVPMNQNVYIKPLESRGFDYRVVINEAILPGKWQYIFHHGVYYPISIDSSFQKGLLGGRVFNAANDFLRNLRWRKIAGSSWGMFYFNARYAIDRQEMKVIEVCKFDLKELGG